MLVKLFPVFLLPPPSYLGSFNFIDFAKRSYVDVMKFVQAQPKAGLDLRVVRETRGNPMRRTRSRGVLKLRSINLESL
jgi:hypothetical protein